MINLRKIFKYYKKKYRLNTKLILNYEAQECIACLQVPDNQIRLKTKYIKNSLKSGSKVYLSMLKKCSTNEKEITALLLLHEIKHAIDYERKDIYLYNILCNVSKYEKNHNKFKAERNADNFAKREYTKKQWIN